MLCFQQQKSSQGLNPRLHLLSPSIKKLMSAQVRATRRCFATARTDGAGSPAQGMDPLTRPCPLPQRAASTRIRRSCTTLQQRNGSCKSLRAPAGSLGQLCPSTLPPDAALQHPPALPSPTASSSRTTAPEAIRAGKRRPARAASSPPRSSSPAALSRLALPSGLLRLWDAQGGHTRGTAASLDELLPHQQPQLPLAVGQPPVWGDAPPLDQAMSLAPTTNGSYQTPAQLCCL